MKEAYRGRRLSGEAVAGTDEWTAAPALRPTWRGWTLGVLAVVALCAGTPYVDFVVHGTFTTINSLNWFAFTALFVLALACCGKAGAAGSRLLTRADVTLVFAMTMAVCTIPGFGLMSYLSNTMYGLTYYARPENGWHEVLLPHLNPALYPQDPPDPASADPRPVEWFVLGLPPGAEIPWAAWVRPYALWALAFAALYGLMFALAALLERHWSEREVLAFPIAQLPAEVLLRADETRRDRLFWWGAGAVFALHGWNALSDYVPGWPLIPLANRNLHAKYLTEPPWTALGVMDFMIYPSVIGITFILAAEVSFSLWFFHILQKLIVFGLFVGGAGLGARYFGALEGHRGAFLHLGTGAMLALVAGCVVLAGPTLWASWRRATGRSHEPDPPEELSSRVLWLLLALSGGGLTAWLNWAGVAWWVAALTVLATAAVLTGCTRLVAESGIFALQVRQMPPALIETAFTPAALGTRSFVVTQVWEQTITADFFRLLLMPNLMNLLHLARLTGLNRRSLGWGVALALPLALAVSFASLMLLAFHHPGGANDFGWRYRSYTKGQLERIGRTSNELRTFETKRAAAKAEGRTVPAGEYPRAAKLDRVRLGWIGAGLAAMGLLLFLRRRIFWLPHPIGFVMWMCDWPMRMIWFALFLGWLLKVATLKYGGFQLYGRVKRWCIGMVFGEAAAAVFWILLAILNGRRDGYAIHID